MADVEWTTDDKRCLHRSVADYLKERADDAGDKEAFVIYYSDTDRRSITFSTLYDKCRQFAASLNELGIRKRDKVVFYLCNSIEFLITQFGVMMTGAIPVNTYITAHGSSDLINVLKKIRPVALILEKSFPGTRINFSDIHSQCASLKYIIATDIKADIGKCLSYMNVLENSSMQNYRGSCKMDPGDVALVMRTSGTTGKPKYISYSYQNILRVTNKRNTIRGTPLRTFSNAYFSYTGGYPFQTVKNGTTRVTMYGWEDRVRLENALKVVEQEYCNVFILSFATAKEIMARQLSIPKSVKVVGIGGTPLSKDIGKLLDYVPCLHCTYGITEFGAIAEVFIMKKSEMEDNIGGFPVKGVEIKVVDEWNREVNAGIHGRIMVKTPHGCSSYTNAENDEEEVTLNGWMDTSDVGYISERGVLYVLGRCQDSITVDECTFHSSEVDNTFKDLGIDGIEDIVSVPIPDEEYYQRVCACIIRKRGSQLTEEEFLAICKANRVRKVLIPKYVVFMDSFPVNVNHKIRRNALIEQAIQKISLKAE